MGKIFIGLLIGTAAVYGALAFLKTNPAPVVDVGQIVTPTKGEENPDSLMTQEQVINRFFAFINDRQLDKAIMMMSEKMVPNETIRQQWGVHFNIFKTIRVKLITSQPDRYRVDLEVQLKPEGNSGPIPYFGWTEGENTRWLRLEKIKEVWKISEITTGP